MIQSVEILELCFTSDDLLKTNQNMVCEDLNLLFGWHQDHLRIVSLGFFHKVKHGLEQFTRLFEVILLALCLLLLPGISFPCV